MAIAIKKIKDELMSRVDEEDAMQVEKVERYIGLVELLRRLQKVVKDEGVTSETINGQQSFTKSHPAITEIAKVNSQLLSLEKSFAFKTNKPSEKPPEKKVSLT